MRHLRPDQQVKDRGNKRDVLLLILSSLNVIELLACGCCDTISQGEIEIGLVLLLSCTTIVLYYYYIIILHSLTCVWLLIDR